MRRELVAAVLCLLLGAMLAVAVITQPLPLLNLADQVATAMPHSGVEHPVTAVLLNFRSYDTLLEIAVLIVAAVIGVAASAATSDSRPLNGQLHDPLLARVLPWLVPLMLLVAGYLLWAGSHQPGGAFQGGAVLAATGVLLRLAGIALPQRQWMLRLGLALGFAVFLLVAVGVTLDGGPLLAYPKAYAGRLILIIEAALTVSIGLILLSLFRATPPAAAPGPAP